MNISQENAEQSLTEIEKTAKNTTKFMAATYSSAALMLWGTICAIAFIGSHILVSKSLYNWIWPLWIVTTTIGSVLTFLIYWMKYRSANPIKNPAMAREGWRDFFFWILLFVYLAIWLRIGSRWSGLQMNAFICTVIMFAYVVSGLYEPVYRFMTWLGLVGTALTLFGFFFVPSAYYCLWMAFALGGALFITGLYLRLRWK